MQYTKGLIFFLFLLASIIQSPLLAQPQISGPQSGTLGPGIYLVVGDISVPPSQTLTILPGTTFQHTGPYQWDIYGRLYAEGTESDSIYFVNQDTVFEHRWQSLRFQTGASDASTIDYCVIANSGNGFSSESYGGIYTNGVDITVTNTRISNCDSYYNGGGIHAENAGISVENCLIVDNASNSGSSGGGGIYLCNCSGASIRYSEIAHNSAVDG